MSRTSGYRLSVTIFGLAVCLTMPACRTCPEKACAADEVSAVSDPAHDTQRKLKETIIPEMTFYAPATLVDAIDFLNKASHEYAKLGTPLDQRGVSFDLRLPSFVPIQSNREGADPFAAAMATNCAPPRIAAMSVRAISLFDAIQLVCEATDMKWRIQQNGTVMLFSKAWDEGGEGITRTYSVPQTLVDSLFSSHDGQASDADPNKVWKTFFEQLGVTESKWTEFDYLPIIGKLRVTSTTENLAIIDQVFEVFALRMVEMEMQIHAFRTADIERLRLSGGMSLWSLMALRKNGKAKQVASATALTKSGQEAIVKAVQEVLYPTELLTNVPQAGSNVTVQSAANALIPSYTAMRETGMILHVIPEISVMDCSQIHVTLKPQWITLEGWESYPADLASGWVHRTHSFKQPMFGMTSFETQVRVKNGGTLLLGSCSTPFGELVTVAFLTARLKDVEPDPSACQREKSTSRGELKNAATIKKLKMIQIPEARWNPSYTIIDAMRGLKDASIQYDDSGVPETERGFNFVVKLPATFWDQKRSFTNADPFAEPESETNGVPIIPPMGHHNTLYDRLQLMCDVTGMEFEIRDGIVWIKPIRVYAELYHGRIYTPVPPLYVLNSADTNSCTTISHEQQFNNYFEQLGLWWWPRPSSVRFLPSINMWHLKGSRYFHDMLKKFIGDFGLNDFMLEVDVQIHAFPAEEIEQLRRSGDISMEALMTLRKNGKSQQVASATVLTKSGQEAIVKAVREVIYPTELLTELNQTECNVALQSATQALVPGNFKTQEVGMILQITPAIATPDASQINVTLYPRWVTQEGWQSYPADRLAGWTHKKLPFKQPIFGVTSFETQTVVEAGKTVLLGSSSTPDGKWVHVGFLTVK